MEERVKTSFIPKTSLAEPTARVTHGNPAALANLIAGALLVLAIVGAGAVYAFQQYTAAQIVSKQDSLAKSREAFEPSTIKELARLDQRIETGKTLLGSHIAASKLFDELERLTLSSVRYTTFEYSVPAPGHVVLTMNGEAQSFNAVALQSEAFGGSPLITDPIFSNVNVSSAGNITFDFTGILDVSHMGYSPDASTTGAGASQVPASPASSTPAP